MHTIEKSGRKTVYLDLTILFDYNFYNSLPEAGTVE
jgi:hypothetical protein